MSDDSNSTAAPPSETALRLRAETTDDLLVFSAVLQDAVTVAADMAWLPGERRFALMLNRYLWEEEAAQAAGGARRRIRCALHFDSVQSVALRDISRKARAKPLELLALHADRLEDGGGTVYLLFAGGGAIRLAVECIDGYLSDTGEAWPCRHRPDHKA